MANLATGIEPRAINTLRTLAMDAVQAADSGHPGTPMALAPVAYTLWTRTLRYDPEFPLWPARDRFVLSCGHASMLLYGLLHLAGVKQCDPQGQPTGELAVPLEHIRRFRQLGSRCPGHPEFGHTSGVETTTGPLGQGAGNSVGMAIAQRWLSARYDRPGFQLFDYRIYALVSDGDLMEGVGCEAASLAGHLRLGNLCWIYDQNHITIDGRTDLSFTEDVPARFEALGWQVLRAPDPNDVAQLERALLRAQETPDRPTLIVVPTLIGYGAPTKQDTSEAHGAPLGEAEVRGAKQAYGWPEDAQFLVPEEVARHVHDAVAARGGPLRRAWQSRRGDYHREHPELAAELERFLAGRLPDGWPQALPTFPADAKGMASRVSSGKTLVAVAQQIPWLMGGAADLASSTKTTLTFAPDFQADQPSGRNLHFGVREHVMGAVLNGLALSGLRPFGSTFLVFSDYVRPSIRLSALMQLPVTYVFTHDSIAVGEDGPTHQPIEHLAALRAIPQLTVLRPADANEVVEAWRTILSRPTGPVAIILTRQNLPTFDRGCYAPAADVARGAYILSDAPGGPPQVLLLASGSEVALCLTAQEQLAQAGIRARVVSMPSWELFEEQPEAYRCQVLPPNVRARVAIEAGIEQGWSRYVGPHGTFIGMQGYGASAPAAVVARHFGITADAVVAAARQLVAPS